MKGLLTIKNGKIKVIETSDNIDYLLSKQASDLFFFHTHNDDKCNQYIPSVNDIILTHTKILKYHFIIVHDTDVIVLQKTGKIPMDLSSYTEFLEEHCRDLNLCLETLKIELQKINIKLYYKWKSQKGK